jgi:hypothetical protein
MQPYPFCLGIHNGSDENSSRTQLIFSLRQ